MYVLGTAGHIDHGKSLLVQALTGIDPDRLREEKERGMTIVLGFANLVDALFLKYTGKPVQTLLKESAQRPRELPAGEKTAPADPDILLADAYAILGLKPDASMDDVKKHYRNLAFAFHSDRGGMNDEAMKLINRAYETITKPKGGK